MARSYSKSKGRSDGSRFMSLPYSVLDSEDYRSLSCAAKNVLTALFWQFNGGNNGDLSLTHARAKEWGIKSKSTLASALQALIAKNLIIRTRDPLRDRQNPHGQCSLYAVTWLKIHECGGKLDVSPTQAPPKSFFRGLKGGSIF